PARGEAAGIGGALLARGNVRGQDASRITWLRGREFCQSTGRHEHLRRDRRARLWPRAQYRLRGGAGDLPDRHRDADVAGPRSPGTRSREAGHLERLSHDVARAAQRRRAATDSGLRSLVDARVTERAVRYRVTGVAALGGSTAPAVCRGKAFFQTACVQAPSGFCATGLLAAEDSTSTVRW